MPNLPEDMRESQTTDEWLDHVMGLCMCFSEEAMKNCWYSQTYNRVKSEVFDVDDIEGRVDKEMKQAILARIAAERTKAEKLVIDIAHKPCECGRDHFATPVRSVTGVLTSYCQFSRVVLSDTATHQERKEE